MAVKFSILMPTRNRARYLAAAVGLLLSSPRSDFEIIASDASDTHHDVCETLSHWKDDPRLVIIDNSVKATGRVSSMVENWSCALDAAGGDWISIIGDDDVIDISALDFISHIERVAPNVGAISWHKCHFDIDVLSPREAKIPMGTKIMLVAGRDSVLKQAGWPNPLRPPSALASPYHGSVRRQILQQVQRQRGGNWFFFQNPDYDLGWTVAWMDTSLVVSERPFSVAGVSKLSNSFAVRSADSRRERLQQWLTESKFLDGWGNTSSEFFGSLPMGVLGFRNAFCNLYGIDPKLNVQNLIQCVKVCIQSQEDDLSFSRLRAEAGLYFTNIFQDDFGISQLERMGRPRIHYAGLAGDILSIKPEVFGGDIISFCRVAFSAVRPVEYLFGNSIEGGFTK